MPLQPRRRRHRHTTGTGAVVVAVGAHHRSRHAGRSEFCTLTTCCPWRPGKTDARGGRATGNSCSCGAAVMGEKNSRPRPRASAPTTCGERCRPPRRLLVLAGLLRRSVLPRRGGAGRGARRFDVACLPVATTRTRRMLLRARGQCRSPQWQWARAAEARSGAELGADIAACTPGRGAPQAALSLSLPADGEVQQNWRGGLVCRGGLLLLLLVGVGWGWGPGRHARTQTQHADADGCMGWEKRRGRRANATNWQCPGGVGAAAPAHGGRGTGDRSAGFCRRRGRRAVGLVLPPGPGSESNRGASWRGRGPSECLIRCSTVSSISTVKMHCPSGYFVFGRRKRLTIWVCKRRGNYKLGRGAFPDVVSGPVIID